MNYQLNWNEYAKVARKAVAEGCVLIENKNQVLPLNKGAKVAVFGRMQAHYIKSGTGSGGLVNAPYVVGVLDALESSESIEVNQELKQVYMDWIKVNPFDRGKGWAQEPWAQVEMEVSDELVEKAAQGSEVAIVIIGRQAGEDRDNTATQGSYLLTEQEEKLLGQVCDTFSKVVVLLNVGNVMDMKWMKKYNPQAVMYIWQGGCEGGNGVLDVLTGKISPSGKLVGTIANDIKDYPSTSNFGNEDDNVYQEDIYVGYRYFETFASDKVMYPFGYGLSYTSFGQKVEDFTSNDTQIEVKVRVTNTGNTTGKEVVQLFLNPPQGVLGKPVRNLVAFAKTEEIKEGGSETITLSFDLKDFASYDDSGATGHPYAYVLEKGAYKIYLGSNVRDCELIGTKGISELLVVEQLSQVCAPVDEFTRMKPEGCEGAYHIRYESVPVRAKEYVQFKENTNLPVAKATGDKGYKLWDVKQGKVSLDEFLAQLSDDELIYLTRGEGMCSPKVTPGTAAAFGGVTDSLLEYGIPLACCADGPSGIRLDSGSMAYAIPNGTALASTFNKELNKEIFSYLALEMCENEVDTLLGPGINIHRNPLNGRNFEYFSEDPYLTGVMAVAQLSAMHQYGVTGTIKHFACNNQEFARSLSNSVISERAIREIYLKAYEMAVKEAGAYSIMSTYGAVNGLWTASYYDLLTEILRNEWGFEGIVMTDWWAKMNHEGGEATMTNTVAMIQAQNDVYMVVDNALENSMKDNTKAGMEQGAVTRELLLRGAKNICAFMLKSEVLLRCNGMAAVSVESVDRFELEETRCTILSEAKFESNIAVVDCSNLDTSKGASAKVCNLDSGQYSVSVTVSANVKGIAQVPLTIYRGKKAIAMITLNKENCTDVTLAVKEMEITADAKEENFIKLFFAEGGMNISEFKIIKEI